MGAFLGGAGFGVDASEVAYARAAVVGGVCVKNFFVEAAFGDADAIVAADDGSGVQQDDQKVFAVTGAADERDNAVVAVVAIDPFEPRPFEIDLMEGGFLCVETVQV